MWLGPGRRQRAWEGVKAGRDAGCGMAVTGGWAGVGMRLKGSTRSLGNEPANFIVAVFACLPGSP